MARTWSGVTSPRSIASATWGEPSTRSPIFWARLICDAESRSFSASAERACRAADSPARGSFPDLARARAEAGEVMAEVSRHMRASSWRRTSCTASIWARSSWSDSDATGTATS